MLETYLNTMDRVQEINLSSSNRYSHSGLSFQFVSSDLVALDMYVTVKEFTGKITNIAFVKGYMGCADLYAYTVNIINSNEDCPKSFKLLHNSKVSLITDPELVKNIKRAESYC